MRDLWTTGRHTVTLTKMQIPILWGLHFLKHEVSDFYSLLLTFLFSTFNFSFSTLRPVVLILCRCSRTIYFRVFTCVGPGNIETSTRVHFTLHSSTIRLRFPYRCQLFHEMSPSCYGVPTLYTVRIDTCRSLDRHVYTHSIELPDLHIQRNWNT